MKLVVQTNHLGRQILYRIPDPVKKRRQYFFRQYFQEKKAGLSHAK